MSGPETAGLVIGLIAGTIEIIDAAKSVYDAAQDRQGLPSTFREVAQRLPLVHEILDDTKAHVARGYADDEASETAKSTLEACRGRAEKLKEIFQKVIPQEGGSSLDRYYRAVRTLGKGSRVEILMKGILDDLSLLAVKYGMETAGHIKELKEGIDAMSNLEPSVPDDFFDRTSYTNTNSGPGTQNNFNSSGGTNYNNTGGGSQFNGAIQTLNWGKQ